MQRASNQLHFTVGVFVIATTALIILFSVWIAGMSTRDIYRHYIIYFKESVYGVNIGTEVAYKGFQVGKVSDIALDPRDPEHIRVIVEIEPNTPIKEDSLATLKPKGVTGLTFIEIIGGSKDSPPLTSLPGEAYPVIQTSDSLLGKVTVGVPELIDRLLSVSDNIAILFNNDNINTITRSLENIEEITEAFSNKKVEIEELIASTNALVKNLEKATDENGELIGMVKDIRKAAEQFERFIADNRDNFENFSDATLRELTDTLRSTKKAADEIESLAESLKEDPSQLIFSPDEKGYRIPK